MYGTVARLQLKPGSDDKLQELVADSASQEAPSGAVAAYALRTDDDQNIAYLIAVFEDEATYRENAESPEQAEQYQKLAEVLAAEPEWHDGEFMMAVHY